jgi:hypothetical protein
MLKATRTARGTKSRISVRRAEEHEQRDGSLEREGGGEVVPPSALGILAEEEGRSALRVHEEVLYPPDPRLRQHPRAPQSREHGLEPRPRKLDGTPVEDPGVGLRIDREGGVEAVRRPHHEDRRDPHDREDDTEGRELAGAGGHLAGYPAERHGQRGIVQGHDQRGQSQHRH